MSIHYIQFAQDEQYCVRMIYKVECHQRRVYDLKMNHADMTLLRGVVYRMNSGGPRTDP